LSDEEADRIIYGMWQHLFRMICEMVQLPRRFRLATCSDVLDFERRDDCVRALCSGRPVLFLGGHFGNWEISVNTFGHFGFPMGVVARPLDNPYLHQWFKDFRESTGNTLILKHGAGSELTDIMEAGGMASLLCDQDAGRSGVFVDFFGRPASTFKSIALIALQYNALIVVGGAFRLPESAQHNARWIRFSLTTQDVIDAADYQGSDGITQLTQRFTSALESLIRKAPEQYFWVHRRWKTPPDARRKRRESAA
jgi:KDO2-lipid IV(A) lauroyltransferase